MALYSRLKIPHLKQQQDGKWRVVSKLTKKDDGRLWNM